MKNSSFLAVTIATVLLFSAPLIFAQTSTAVAIPLAPKIMGAATAKFNAFVTRVSSGQAQFEQVVFDKTGAIGQRASGVFIFARPGKFRWNYVKPAQQIVSDGAKVWIFDQDLNQVTIKKFDTTLSATPAALLTGTAKLDSLFNTTEQGQINGLDWVLATPKQADTGFESVRIGFKGEVLAELELKDLFGNRTQLKFTDLKSNVAAPMGTFNFVPPKGVDVAGE
jgi:outer membrane lipoprotein carrier protein